MNRSFLIAGAIFGGLAVALGAFGAHGLRNITADEEILRGYQTAVQYQVYHALALLVTAILFEKMPGKLIQWAGICFIIGILLFSGSLYALTLMKTQGSSLVKVAGPVTPFGGLFFLAGWLFLLLRVVKKN